MGTPSATALPHHLHRHRRPLLRRNHLQLQQAVLVTVTVAVVLLLTATVIHQAEAMPAMLAAAMVVKGG